ncbi:hypothetical protein JVU11DRAFT_10279 [Chiua virens]|nr:hypothetical protein JVU11DRAFT_10279 [Chiua virens]
MTASNSSSDPTTTVDLFQNSFYIGVNLENILYGKLPDRTPFWTMHHTSHAGIELFLYFKTMRILLTSSSASKRSNVFYAAFSSIMLFLVTIWVAGQAFFGEKMWILEASYPGGPEEYYKQNISVWYVDWGTTAVVLLQLMTDGLMIYRCRIIWNSYYPIVLPIVLWLGCLGRRPLRPPSPCLDAISALGIIVDWATSSPLGDFFSGFASQLGFAYYTVAVVLNTILTCMICYRIVRHGKAVQEHLGKDYASLYFSVVTLIVESVFPYTISGIAFLVSLGSGSSTSVAFVSVYFLMMCISPQMLILRVIMGGAVDNQTFKQPHSTLKFNGPETGVGTTATQPAFDPNGTKPHLQTLSNMHLGDSKV